jgi:hypothetical protein
VNLIKKEAFVETNTLSFPKRFSTQPEVRLKFSLSSLAIKKRAFSVFSIVSADGLNKRIFIYVVLKSHMSYLPVQLESFSSIFTLLLKE